MKKTYINPNVTLITCNGNDILTTSLLFEDRYDGDVRKWSDVF